jgi:hypothetical protein
MSIQEKIREAETRTQAWAKKIPVVFPDISSWERQAEYDDYEKKVSISNICDFCGRRFLYEPYIFINYLTCKNCNNYATLSMWKLSTGYEIE